MNITYCPKCPSENRNPLKLEGQPTTSDEVLGILIDKEGTKIVETKYKFCKQCGNGHDIPGASNFSGTS